jgi:hypothetical protein
MPIDPRTVARDIPGIFDEIFPQLTPGIVMHFNLQAEMMPVRALPRALLSASALQRAMLFELAYSVAENILKGEAIDWPACFQATLERQRAYFDAKLPDQFEAADMGVAELVGRNLAETLQRMSASHGLPLVLRPSIPGLEWIANGKGDFAIGDSLIEVKCTAKRFSSSDYRQVAIYWLLSYAAAIEGRGTEWKELVLFNPRNGARVTLGFDKFLSVISSGRTKVDILQLFESLVGSRLTT